MKNLLLLFGILTFEFVIFSQPIPQFGPEKKVTITGLTHDAMEVFISADEQTLFFNSLNSGGNTNLYYATRVDDTTFTYVGLVGNTYDPSIDHLDGVPSLDVNDRFFWVSLRDYPTIYENLLNSDYSGGSVTSIKHTYGDFNVYLPGWLIMDAAVSYDGDLLYYVNAYFNSCPFGMPCDALIGVAEKVDDTTFNKLPNTDGVFSNVNDPNYIVYAPQVTVDGKELYFTRILDGTINSELCVSVREDIADTFSLPTVIYSNDGFVPEAISVTNDKSKIYYHQKNSLGVFEVYMRYRTATLNMNEDQKGNLIVFPNPTADLLQLQLPQPQSNFTVKIFSTTGQCCLVFQNETTFSVAGLPAGMYVAELETESGIFRTTFEKK
ncbi:MAG: T9SS type A sorting domain-containing protein [Crocinitomicaceae bacterium]|nr:T9SS type A sorting domain-containing protein [Crocinitomicaceae bacterium]MBK9590756.1 T9SS type A sorting domain-containing protein [Crocinitomicaceae bacterium]